MRAPTPVSPPAASRPLVVATRQFPGRAGPGRNGRLVLRPLCEAAAGRPAASAPPVVPPCQFPVSADPERNGRFVLRQLGEAAAGGAHVAHFPEGGLSGYAGADFASFRGFEWETLESVTRRVMARAGELGIWAVIGSAHRLSDGRKPHNCLYIVEDRGRLVDRYDKRFCAGDASGRTGDLAHYTPGNHECCFTIRGVRCGAAICH